MVVIGNTVAHYRILEKIGAGGMGEVYLAEDTKLERKVALKFLPSHLTSDKEGMERFQREAKAAAALNHPNIVTIHEISEHKGCTFIAMEHVKGSSLREEIEKGPMTIDRFIEISTQICEGLREAHGAGIVHRDIKPENIVIDKSGRVRILDFGLARMRGVTKLTKDASTLGTFKYMSPEQYQNKEVDHRTDIWSFGVVLFEMLTGCLPFQGDYESAMMYAIVNEEPEPIQNHRTDLPSGLKDMVNRTLEKNPEKRYQTVDDLMTNLKSMDKRKVHSTRSDNKTSRHLLEKKILLGPAIGIAVLLLVIISSKVFSPSPRNIIQSIAVLPLKAISNDPDQEYLVDGITDALISELSKIEALRVISRTSVMRYKETNKSLPQIARELSVDAIVQGSALIANDRIRVSAQLIEAKTDNHLWTDDYNRDLKDIFALQTEVTQDIAAKIQIQLTPNDEARLGEQRAVNPEAYRHYAAGMRYRYIEGESYYQRAIDHLEKAIELDPDFALAYARLSLCLTILVDIYRIEGENTAVRARTAAEKALELNANLAEAHIALGLIEEFLDRDAQAAEASFRRAIQLNPGSYEGHHEYGLLLFRTGLDIEQSMVEMELAVQLDPISHTGRNALMNVLLMSREMDRAIQMGLQSIKEDPNSWIMMNSLVMAYIFKGERESALQFADRLLALDRGKYPLGTAGWAYGVAGQRDKALEIIQELTEKWPDDVYPRARVEAGLGNWDPFLTHLEEEYTKGSYNFHWVYGPMLDPIRSGTRVQSLMKKMGVKVEGDLYYYTR